MCGLHDDVIKWKHFPRYWTVVRGIHRSPVNSPHKGQWCGVLVFFMICAWINGWVNNGEAADLRHHRVPYDVTVIFRWISSRAPRETSIIHLYLPSDGGVQNEDGRVFNEMLINPDLAHSNHCTEKAPFSERTAFLAWTYIFSQGSGFNMKHSLYNRNSKQYSTQCISGQSHLIICLTYCACLQNKKIHHSQLFFIFLLKEEV